MTEQQAPIVAVFVGGPFDDAMRRFETEPPPTWRLRPPAQPSFAAWGNAADPFPEEAAPVAEYRLRIDATGHPSRTDDGIYRYDFERMTT